MKKVVKVRACPDVVELEAFGVTSGMNTERPVMLFREIGGEAVLPVWLSRVDAGVALSQQHVAAPGMSPHDVTLNVLKTLGVAVDSCWFVEIRGHQQYVDLKFAGSRKLKVMRVRADHAISFCLQARTRFFCTREFLKQCRVLEAEINKRDPLMRREEKRRGSQTYLN